MEKVKTGERVQLPEENTDWEKLVKDLKGKHAQRMNDCLDELSDKQFRIVYPKLLEFIVPKMQRKEVLKEVNNNTNILQIQYVESPEQIKEYKKINEIEDAIFDEDDSQKNF